MSEMSEMKTSTDPSKDPGDAEMETMKETLKAYDIMDESAEKTEAMKKIIVRIGYAGNTDETRPVRFTGKEVAEASNHDYQGENQNRWHDWTLYEVETPLLENMKNGIRLIQGYRVYDHYRTQWQGEVDHHTLSDVLTPQQVAEEYPVMANEYFAAKYIAEDLD